MAISLETINVGVENQAAGSDSIYVAFSKARNNFATLSNMASPYTNFVGSNGISVGQYSGNNTIVIQNTGVVDIVAGTGLLAAKSNTGQVTISLVGTGNGNTVAGVTNVNMTSSTLNVSGGPIISSGTFTVNLPQLPVSGSFSPGSYIAPNVTVDSYGRITAITSTTSVGTVTSFDVVANGEGLTVTGGPITTTGTIYIENTGVTRINAGPGIGLSSNTGEITIYYDNPTGGTVTSVTVMSNTLNIVNPVVTTAGEIEIDIPQDLTLDSLVAGNLTANDNVVANTITANLDIIGGNTVSANYFIGDGGLLSNVAPVRRAESANVVTNNAQPNITSVGTLASLSVTGNISTAANINVTGKIAVTSNANVGNLGTSGLIVATGNITGGNLSTSGRLTATGNVTGSNLSATGTLTATGNIAGGNISTAGNLTVTNTATLGNLVVSGTATFSGNLAGANLSTAGSLTVGSAGDITGNLTAGNITSSGLLSVTTDATVTGNLSANFASVTNNLSANFANISNGLKFQGTTTGVGINWGVSNGPNIYIDTTQNSLELSTKTGWVELNYNNDQFAYADAYEVGIQTNALTGGHYWRFGKDGNLVGDGNLTISTGKLTAANITTTGSMIAAGNANMANINATGNAVITGNANITGNITGGNLTSNANVIASSGVIVISSSLPSSGISDGTIAIDSANTRLAIRIGGLWYYATLSLV